MLLANPPSRHRAIVALTPEGLAEYLDGELDAETRMQHGTVALIIEGRVVSASPNRG